MRRGPPAITAAAAYGFITLFAWVTDRFGVAWQLNYA
jgi:predicted 3-demethylubiquinone-9 3-methyltransferase (glyoxalase superfamily)